MAIMALPRLGPRKAASAMARMRNGQASMASVMRLISRVDEAADIAGERGRAARRSPSAMPTEMTPAISEARAPKMTRARISRPTSSVPNQCSADGGLRTDVQLCAIGS